MIQSLTLVSNTTLSLIVHLLQNKTSELKIEELKTKLDLDSTALLMDDSKNEIIFAR